MLHPVLSMFSRVHNTVTWTKYRTVHALQQLKASVLCAREFLLDLSTDPGVDERERRRAVLGHYEDVFDLCVSTRGRQVQHFWEIDPFDVVLPLDALPEKFRTVRYPQMASELARRRAKAPPKPDGSLRVGD